MSEKYGVNFTLTKRSCLLESNGGLSSLKKEANDRDLY